MYAPDFTSDCRICGTSPTVVVLHHKYEPHTDLCGPHFFNDPQMTDWDQWPTNPPETDHAASR